ncbi:MAG: hypothetical protein RSB52_07870, partial [Acidaminococcaceae bacterium]
MESEIEQGKPLGDDDNAMNPAIQAVAGIGMAAEFLANQLHNPLSATKNIWENMKQTDALKIYLQNKPEKLAEIKNISVKTGLPEAAITDDNIDDARKVYNERVKLEALTPLGEKEFDLNKLYESFPALKGLDNSNDIAIALHNIENVKETHSIFEAGNVGLERGILSREISNIGKKYIYGGKSEISEEDLIKVQELENKLFEMKRIPGLFEDPLESIVGSTLEQSYRYGPGLLKGMAMGGATATAGALAGGALTGTTGAVEGAKFGWQWGLKLGLGSDMFNEIAGSKFLEYSRLRNKEGEALLSFNDAVAYATMAASVETGIEFWNYDSIMNVLAGSEHKQAIKNIIASSVGKEEVLGGIKRYLTNALSGSIEVAKGEIAEEMFQDVNEKVWMNSILSANPNNSYKKYDVADMLKGATEAGMEALPSVIGMGAMAGGGSTISGIRAVARMSKVREEYSLGQLRNLFGTNMLSQLRKNMEVNELYKKSPEVYEAVVTEEMKSTPYKTVYVDTELAQQNEETKEVYKQLAQASGYNEEEVAAAIDNKVPLAVPSQIYNKIVVKSGIDTTDELISFSATDDCLKRKNEAAKILDAELSAIVTKNAEQQAKLLESFINENFPKEDEARAIATEIILQNPNAPSKGWADMRKEVQHIIDAKLSDVYALMAKDAPAQKVIEVGGDNKGVNVSEQANWYNNWHKANGRVPSKEDMEEIAYDIFTGLGDKYGYADSMPKTVEEQEAVKMMKAEMDADLAKRARLDEIKPQMEKMTETEITRVQNLSPEGYVVYSNLIDMFAGATNKKVVRQQREGAIMMAYVADNYARIRSEATGESYTAQDYLKDKFGLDVNGEKVTRDGYNQPITEMDLDLDEKIPVLDLDTMPNILRGKTPKEIVEYIKKISSGTENSIPTADFKAIVGLPQDSDKYGQVHIVRANSNKDMSSRNAKDLLIGNFREVISLARLVEVSPNKKNAEIKGLKGSRKQAQKRKNSVKNFYRMFVPIKLNNDLYTIIITAEAFNERIELKPQNVSFYEVKAIKNRSAVAFTANERLATNTSSISIRDALADVKDGDGISYINADGSGNFKLYNQSAMREENKRFVLNSSGDLDWGYVSETHTADDGTKIKAAPIRLQIGYQVGKDTAGAG